jgi:hypothetical protein
MLSAVGPHAPPRRSLALASLAILLALSPRPAHAQLEVTVTDSAGQVLADARVELWRTAQLLTARTTDARGMATFDAAELATATDVRVRRLGYAPARVSLDQPGGTLRVQLASLARSLPSLTVSATVGACPQSDDQEARALWSRIGTRYREPAVEGRHTTLDHRVGTVEQLEIGHVHDGDVYRGALLFTADGMRGAHEVLALRGYVYAVPDSHNLDLLGGWQYVQLDAELAGHFATQAFADAHTFTVASRRAATTTLRFCAKDRRRPGLDGILQLSERDGLVEAHWRFWNPLGGAEPAGGAVTFALAQPDSAPAPLSATSGLFWRQLPSGKYLQRWQGFHDWQLLTEGARVPDAARLAERCHPPPNYVLCSVSSVGVRGGATLSNCLSMAYQCFDD